LANVSDRQKFGIFRFAFSGVIYSSGYIHVVTRLKALLLCYMAGKTLKQNINPEKNLEIKFAMTKIDG
jgi:hypothetical protein